MKTVIRKDVLALAAPILVEQAFVNLLGIVNTIMAARIGKEAISAVGMVDSLYALILAFFSALALGGTVVVAQYTGQGNRKMANVASMQVLVSGVLVSLVLALLVFIFRVPLLHGLFSTADPRVMENMNTYLSIALFTYPLSAFSLIVCGSLRGAGDTRTPMKVNSLMNVMNVLLSYVCIYGIDLGIWHLPGFGVAGAATGLGLARLAGVLYLVLILSRRDSLMRLDGLRNFRFDLATQRAIFSIGIPASIESFMFQGGKLITQIMVVGMGTAAIAANYIAFSVVLLINIPGNALSMAATTLVGQHMGRGDEEGAENTLRYVVKLATVCLVSLGLLCFPLTSKLAGLYSSDTGVIYLTSIVLRINCLFMLFYATTFVLPSGLRGAGDAKYAMVTTLIGMWLFRIVLGYCLGVVLGMGLVGVWCGMFADWLVRSALYVRRLRSGRWKGNQVISQAG